MSDSLGLPMTATREEIEQRLGRLDKMLDDPDYACDRSRIRWAYDALIDRLHEMDQRAEKQK